MSDLNSVESKWNSLSRIDKSILLNESNIDFIEAGMESYPTSEDYHTNSAYQTILKQKLVEYASSPFAALPISIKDKVTETFRDQGIITEAEEIDNDYKMEGEPDGYADSEGTDFSYKDTDKEVDDIEKEATEAYHYSLYTHVKPEGLSLSNLKKAREIVKDETDKFYESFFEAMEVDYPYKEEVPVTRPDNPVPVGKYNDNPNAGLYDTKLFKWGSSNADRIGEVLSEQDVLDWFTPSENNNYNHCDLCDMPIYADNIDEMRYHLLRDHRGQVGEARATEVGADWWGSRSKVEQEQILIASGVDVRHAGLSWQNLGQENQKKIQDEYGYGEIGEAHDLDDQSSDFQYHKLDSSDLLRTDQIMRDAYGKPVRRDGLYANLHDVDLVGRADRLSSIRTNSDEIFPQNNEIDRQREASEDVDDYNIYDRLKTDGIEKEKYSPEVESEDAIIAQPDKFEGEEDHVPETNTNPVDAEKEANETYKCDDCNEMLKGYETADIHEKEYGHSATEYTGRTKGTEAVIPYSAESEIESKIIERKLAGHSDQSIARELGIWHNIEMNEAFEKINAVEVSTDDKAAYSLFGKRFTQITEVEKDEMRTLAGETYSPKEEDF